MGDVRLVSFSVGTGSIVRGSTDGVAIAFELSGHGTLTLTIQDSAGGLRDFIIEGTSGTARIELDGIEYPFIDYQSPADVSSYTIIQAVVEGQDGTATVYDEQALQEMGAATTVAVTSDPETAPVPTVIAFELLDGPDDRGAFDQPRFSIEFADGTDPFLFAFVEVGSVDDPDFRATTDVNHLSGTGILNVANARPTISGEYYIMEITVMTALGDTIRYTREDLEEAGFDVTFTYNAPFELLEPSEPPTLVGFEILDQQVDHAAGEQLQFSFQADGDDVSSFSVTLIDENGHGRAYTGAFTDGVLSIDVDNAFFQGSIRVGSLRIRMNDGELYEYSEQDLQDLGFATTIEFLSSPAERPEGGEPLALTSLSVTESDLDFDAGEYELGLQLLVADQGPLANATVIFTDPETGRYFSLWIGGAGSAEGLLSPFLAGGTYQVSRVFLRSVDGQQIVYNQETLVALGYDFSVTISNSNEDLIQPELVSLDLTSDVDAETGEVDLSIHYVLSEEELGYYRITFFLLGPDGRFHSAEASLEQGAAVISLPADAADGEYQIYRISFRDKGGTDSKHYLNPAIDYEARGWDLDFDFEYLGGDAVQTSIEIVSEAPAAELVRFEVLTESVDPEDEPRIDFLFETDIAFGSVDHVTVKFLGPDGSIHAQYVNGDSGISSVALPEWAVSGQYELLSVEIWTGQGVVTRVEGDELVEFLSGVPDTVTVDLGEGAPLGISFATTPEDFLQTQTVEPTGDPMVDALLMGIGIATPDDGPLVITFSFAGPDSYFATDFANYGRSENWTFYRPHNVHAFNGEEQQIVRDILAEISSYTNVIFVEVPENGEQSAGHMRFAWTDGTVDGSIIPLGAAWAFEPGANAMASDVWLTTWGIADVVARDTTDTYLRHVLAHEIGHALGLKHPHEIQGQFPRLPSELDGYDYTQMSYVSLADTVDIIFNIHPQTFMSLDIAALQEIYGQNLSLSAGSDVYQFLPGLQYYQTIWDAGGHDMLDASQMAADVRLDLTPGRWSDVGTGVGVPNFDYRSDTIFLAADTVIEDALGGAGDDTLTGNSAANRLEGNGGNDVLKGGSGNDILIGGAGGDTLSGSVGDDSLSGGGSGDRLFGDDGADTLDGGGGADRVDYLKGNDAILVDLETGETAGGFAEGDVLVSIESVFGGKGDDTLRALESGSRINGAGGDDIVEGRGGDDRLSGGNGNDVVSGGAGDDLLNGFRGNDTINGGAGDDTLRGSSGADTFVFAAGDGDDMIVDFRSNDFLDLSASATDFASLADVQAAATETVDGLLIDLGGGDSVLLQGQSLSILTEEVLIL